MQALDEFMPVYEFSERHALRVRAPADRVDAAVRTVAAEDIPVVRALLALRAPGRPHDRRPFVEHGRRLADVPGEGVVVGLRGDFWRLRARGGDACEAVVDFRIEGGVLSTETRVHVADPASRRLFARYWRLIRPFSGLTRILFLREVRRRAERATLGLPPG